MSELKWGIVSTVKAAKQDVLGFVAYHLQREAHRLYITLMRQMTPHLQPSKPIPKCA